MAVENEFTVNDMAVIIARVAEEIATYHGADLGAEVANLMADEAGIVSARERGVGLFGAIADAADIRGRVVKKMADSAVAPLLLRPERDRQGG